MHPRRHVAARWLACPKPPAFDQHLKKSGDGSSDGFNMDELWLAYGKLIKTVQYKSLYIDATVASPGWVS